MNLFLLFVSFVSLNVQITSKLENSELFMGCRRATSNVFKKGHIVVIRVARQSIVLKNFFQQKKTLALGGFLGRSPYLENVQKIVQTFTAGQQLNVAKKNLGGICYTKKCI